MSDAATYGGGSRVPDPWRDASDAGNAPKNASGGGGAGEGPAGGLVVARKRTRRVLLAERAAPLLAPAATIAGGYILAGLLRAPQSLPDGAHLALLLGTSALTAWLARRGWRRLREPTLIEIDRRIEQASNLRNRPLASLTDHSSGLGSNELWRAYQERLVASLGPLRSGWPRPAFTRRDPWIAGGLLVPALAVALVMAGSHAPGRLAAAFVPGWDDPDTPMPHVDAWITPPGFALSAPVFLNSGDAPAPVPQGSVVTASVTGLNGAPRLVSSGVEGESVKALDPRSWRLDATLEHGGALALKARGRVIARWNVTVTPDAAPMVAWGKDPGGEKGSRRTRLPYEARHSYGIETLTAEIRLAHPSLLGDSRVLRVPIPLSGHPVTAKGVIAPDLSSDPWAGEEVKAVLVARSVSHQQAQSQSVTFTLGSRKFRSPVARAVLDLRKRLALGKESRRAAAEDLAALGDTPGPLSSNTGMFLNLTAIAARLSNPDVTDEDAIAESVARMWDLALDLEDRLRGGDEGAQASIEVRAAQEAVAQQLRHMREDNAHGPEEQAELRRRMEALQQAIAHKMQALTQQALRDKTAIPDLPGLTKSGDDAFRRLMQRMQDDAAEGRSGNAMDKLEQLEDSIEGMRNATPQDMAALGRQLAAQQKLREQTDGLRDIVQQQTKLLDHAQSRLDKERRAEERNNAAREQDDDGDTNLATMSTQELLRKLGLTPPTQEGGEQQPSAESQRNSGQDRANGQENGAPPSGADADRQGQAEHSADSQSASGQSQAGQPNDGVAVADARGTERATQHALERATSELQQEFKDLTGKEPPAFAKAQNAMRDARRALAQGNDGDAAGSEEKALQALQQGGRQMREALRGNGSSSGGTPSFLPALSGGDNGDQSGEGQSQAGDSGAERGDGSDSGSADKDPLGRSTGEGGDNAPGDTHIPDTISRERAHEIEQELRRRDSDRTRPQQELDYLDRLLKSF